MDYKTFQGLTEAERIRAMRRGIKAAKRMVDSSKPIDEKEAAMLLNSLKWLGAEERVKSWEKRVFRRKIK